jgi:hypothetical protein
MIIRFEHAGKVYSYAAPDEYLEEFVDLFANDVEPCDDISCKLLDKLKYGEENRDEQD